MILDATDRTIVALLQKDGRLPLETIAAEVGLSRTATRARVERLLGSGAMRITAVVHPHALGLSSFAHVSLATAGPAYPVARLLAEMEEAPFVSVIAGGHSVMAELRCHDLDALVATISRIGCLPEVLSVDTLHYTRIIKDSHFPLGVVDEVSLDDLERRIVALLQQDGRISFSDLGRHIDLSAGAARQRVVRLIERGVVHVGAMVNGGMVGLNKMIGLEISFVAGEEAQAAGLKLLADQPRIDYLATCLGRCDAVATIVASSDEEAVAALESVRALPGVRIRGTWTHLDLVKERYPDPGFL